MKTVLLDVYGKYLQLLLHNEYIHLVRLFLKTNMCYFQ